MLATMLTAMYLVVRAAEQLGLRWVQQESLPYMVSQPMPWQVHYVSQNRRGSRVEEFDDQRRNSGGGCRNNSSLDSHQCTLTGPGSKDKAATTIQTQYRKYQQKKQKESKW